MRAKSTEKMPSCPSERCLVGVDEALPTRANSAEDESLAVVVVVVVISSPSGSTGVVSGKWRLRLAATVSGLQWRKSLPLPQSLVDEEEVGEVSGEATGELVDDATGLGLVPLKDE